MPRPRLPGYGYHRANAMLVQGAAMKSVGEVGLEKAQEALPRLA